VDTSIVVLKFVGLALESSGVRLASLFEAQYRWTLSFSGGAGFSRAHENNGAGRELCDAMGDAANQQAIQSGEAARSVALFFFSFRSSIRFSSRCSVSVKP